MSLSLIHRCFRYFEDIGLDKEHVQCGHLPLTMKLCSKTFCLVYSWTTCCNGLVVPLAVFENCQHSWAAMNLWLCDKLVLGLWVTCDWTSHRVGLSLSHTQGNQGSLADLKGWWLLNCQNPVSVLGKICQNQNVSVNHLGLKLFYIP